MAYTPLENWEQTEGERGQREGKLAHGNFLKLRKAVFKIVLEEILLDSGRRRCPTPLLFM